jgi:carbon-monoxide dehydrogenase medium subunit
VKPSPFTYHRPGSVEEAVQMLADLGEDAKVLAGGQSLVPLMSMRLAAPAHLVDINHIPGLGAVTVSGDVVRVGALARHADVERHAGAHDAVPLLRRALVHVAHPTIRNRGTTVGSLVHADPAAEMPAVLALLGGTVVLRSAGDSRTVAAGDFFVGPMQSAMRPDELAVAATFPSPPPGSGTAFVELSRRQGDYAMCGVAALVTTDRERALTSAAVALVSVGPGPVVVDVTEAITGSGGGLRPDAVHDLVDAAIEPEADIHASEQYRRHLAHVLTERALDEARGDAVAHRGRHVA